LPYQPIERLRESLSAADLPPRLDPSSPVSPDDPAVVADAREKFPVLKDRRNRYTL